MLVQRQRQRQQLQEQEQAQRQARRQRRKAVPRYVPEPVVNADVAPRGDVNIDAAIALALQIMSERSAAPRPPPASRKKRIMARIRSRLPW